MTSYWRSIVNMALSLIVSEIFCEKYRIWAFSSVRVFELFSWLPDTYVLTVSAISAVVGPCSGAQSPFTSGGHGNLNFRWIATFGSYRNSISCRWSSWTFTFGIAAELRPPLVCDLRTIEVVGSKAPSDWRQRNGSPRASDRTCGSPARKLTRMAGCYELGKLPEQFLWIIGHMLALHKWKEQRLRDYQQTPKNKSHYTYS